MTGERRRRLGVRVRITAFATIIVAAALVAGAFLLTGLLRSRLDDTATTAARLRARDIAGLAASDSLPATLALPGEESAVVQVVSSSGAVVAASQNIDGEPPITTLQPAAGHELVTTMAVTAIDPHDPMRLVAVTTDTPSGPVTVYATESLERSEETVHAIVAVLAVAIPALLGLVGVLTWWAVGRTLRPVRRITHTLGEITTTDLHRRVPDPTTNDEIGELAATVNTTLQRLDVAVERQRRFVADASHNSAGPSPRSAPTSSSQSTTPNAPIGPRSRATPSPTSNGSRTSPTTSSPSPGSAPSTPAADANRSIWPRSSPTKPDTSPAPTST